MCLWDVIGQSGNICGRRESKEETWPSGSEDITRVARERARGVVGASSRTQVPETLGDKTPHPLGLGAWLSGGTLAGTMGMKAVLTMFGCPAKKHGGGGQVTHGSHKGPENRAQEPGRWVSLGLLVGAVECVPSLPKSSPVTLISHSH